MFTLPFPLRAFSQSVSTLHLSVWKSFLCQSVVLCPYMKYKAWYKVFWGLFFHIVQHSDDWVYSYVSPEAKLFTTIIFSLIWFDSQYTVLEEQSNLSEFFLLSRDGCRERTDWVGLQRIYDTLKNIWCLGMESE